MAIILIASDGNWYYYSKIVFFSLLFAGGTA